MSSNIKVEENNLRPLIKQREMLRDQKKNASQMFNNMDDEEENSHIDQMLNEQKEILADRSNQKFVKQSQKYA
jgi:hypothetical protein